MNGWIDGSIEGGYLLDFTALLCSALLSLAIDTAAAAAVTLRLRRDETIDVAGWLSPHFTYRASCLFFISSLIPPCLSSLLRRAGSFV